MIDEIKAALQDLSSSEKKEFLPKFFKAGKGEYAEGDQFIGVTVPDQRQIAKAFCNKVSLEILSPMFKIALSILLLILASSSIRFALL